MLAFSNRSKAKRLKLTKPVIIIGVEIYWTVGSIPRTSTILNLSNAGTTWVSTELRQKGLTTITEATTSYFSMAWSRSNLIKKRGTREVADRSEKVTNYSWVVVAPLQSHFLKV